MEQQQQQQKNNEDNFIDRFLAKFGFRNEQINQQEVNMSNTSIDINYNINVITKDKLTTEKELNVNGEKDKEMETKKQKEGDNNISNDQKEGEIKEQVGKCSRTFKIRLMNLKKRTEVYPIFLRCTVYRYVVDRQYDGVPVGKYF